MIGGDGGLGEEAEEHTGGDGGTDYTGYVGAHSVHEQVVAGVVLQAEVVGNSARHRHSRYAGVADEGVDFLCLRQEEVEELHEEHAGG